MTRSLFLFGWPSHYGGADTKFTDLVRLLCGSFSITVVPNFPLQLDQRPWRDFFETLRVRCCTVADLPDRLEGIALAVGNDLFFTSGICKTARAKGLKIVWSVEMMWSHPGEVEAIRAGEVDRVLYVSEIQNRHLAYERLGSISTRITGNYVDPDPFPFVERPARPFTIGRLSRAAPEKYPEDFPVFYEALDLPDARFRVMAWSDELAAKYRWHRFGPRWELLPPVAEDACRFLASLDLFVYPLGHRFVESWGRSTVEAMLTGLVPLVPPGHHLENLILPGETGFICDDFREYRRCAALLCQDTGLRKRMAENARRHALYNLCDRATNWKLWCEALDV
jgi:glycosyltransferase involved in cell wall biosynthesis